MKNVLYLFFAFLISSTMSCSQNENSNDSEITFKDGLEFDFGKIPFNSEGIHEFVFKNTGKVPLLINNVKTSCGCTVPTYPKEPVEVKATEKISVKYDTKRVGNFHKTITVYSNSKNSPVTLQIKGEVLPEEK